MEKSIGEKVKNRIVQEWSLISIVLFLGFTVCIYAPYEVYLTNRTELWFQISDFWWIPILCCVLIMGLFLGIGLLLPKKIHSIYEGILFGIALAFYMQGNFLNLKVGVLNGADIQWGEYRRHIVIDTFAFLFIIVVILVFALMKKKFFGKVAQIASLFLTATQLAALVIMIVPVLLEGKPQESVGFLSEKGLCEVASEENIIVFLVDMFDDTYFKQIMEEEPEIADELDGFTYFSNFTGGYSTTDYSLMHLMSGEYFHNEMGKGQWRIERGNERLWPDELSEAGYELSMYVPGGGIPYRLERDAANFLNTPLRISNYKGFTKDLYQLVICKYFPDVLKPFIWMDGNELNHWREPNCDYKVYDTNNLFFKNEIEKNGLSVVDTPKQFRFIHIDGSHYPYYINENAQEVEPDSVSAVQCARGVIRIIQSYMDELKEKRCYENASIFIIADHGYYWDGVLTNPVMLVKPKGSTGRMTVSNVAACQKDFPATVLELAGLNENHEYGKSVFEIKEGEERERLFYQYYLMEKDDENRRLIEYRIDSDSNERSSFHLTDVEYTVDGEKIVHSEYCKTCQEGEEEDAHVPPRIVHYRKE